jgi:hypothetical protein
MEYVGRCIFAELLSRRPRCDFLCYGQPCLTFWDMFWAIDVVGNNYSREPSFRRIVQATACPLPDGSQPGQGSEILRARY